MVSRPGPGFWDPGYIYIYIYIYICAGCVGPPAPSTGWVMVLCFACCLLLGAGCGASPSPPLWLWVGPPGADLAHVCLYFRGWSGPRPRPLCGCGWALLALILLMFAIVLPVFLAAGLGPQTPPYPLGGGGRVTWHLAHICETM